MIRRLGLVLFGLAALLIFTIPQSTTAQTISTDFGTNWQASFFPSTDFTGTPVGPITYPNGLNFNWPGQPLQSDGATPVSGFTQADNFSVRFTSTQNFSQTGSYTFTGIVDDRMTVIIDGVEVYNQDAPGNFSFNYTLAAGAHTIQINFVEFTSVAILQFQWTFTGTAPGPTAIVGTPTPAGPTGPVGQVVFVRGLSLRTGPYLGASFISVLRPGIQYPVLARNTDEGGPFTWYKVQAGERIGWASGRYLTVTNGTPPLESTIFEQIDNPPSTGVFAAPNAFMNLRRRPSERSQRLGQIPWGAEVEVLGRTIQGGRDHWLQVRYEEIVGWAYAPFFRFRRGLIDAIPIY
ncbi:MAG: SH3 domain-containing protein [Chloroflexota bacterium]